jgi:hypothetical protein
VVFFHIGQKETLFIKGFLAFLEKLVELVKNLLLNDQFRLVDVLDYGIHRADNWLLHGEDLLGRLLR